MATIVAMSAMSFTNVEPVIASQEPEKPDTTQTSEPQKVEPSKSDCITNSNEDPVGDKYAEPTCINGNNGIQVVLIPEPAGAE